MDRKCVVGYKRGIRKGSTHVYGEIFDKLEPCCDSFRKWFESTGATKINSFSQPYTREKDGLNLVTRGHKQTLVMRLEVSHNIAFENELRFCPFCGSEIEVKCTKSVTLIPRKKEVPDGYDEEVYWTSEESKPANEPVFRSEADVASDVFSK